MKLNYEFADADDYHPEENKNLMRNGVPLNDENRLGWLISLRKLLLKWHQENKNGVLACSALKKKYRHLLNSNLNYLNPKNANESLDLKILFFLLSYDKNVILERLNKRVGHVIITGNTILNSQYQTLEYPSKESAIWIDKELNYLSIEKEEETKSFYFFYFLNLREDFSYDDILNKIFEMINLDISCI